MRVIINDTEFLIPSSLNEITLKQRIDFQEFHGNELNLMSKSISEMEDPEEKELELILFNLESMYRTIAFFTNISVDVLKEYQDINTMLNIYANSMAMVFEQEKQIEEKPQFEFTWKGEEWVLYSPELKNGDKMTFGEMIDSKQVIQDMIRLGKNRWDCLLPLCAIYLKKKGEEYDESFLYPDSDRIKLMHDLPLDIALQVGFFLSSSVSMFIAVSQSFMPQESKEIANI